MRSIRKALRLTQAELAETAGIDSSFYGQIERGKNIPSLKTFLAIARALGVEPASLLPHGKKRPKRIYEKTIERLVEDLNPNERRFVLGMVSDIVQRMKR